MTGDTNATLTDRIDQIERRLLAIESRLSIAPPPAPEAPDTLPAGADAERIVPTPSPTPPAPAAPPTARPPATAPARRRRPKREPVSIETLVGGKVFAVVGALVIVTGLALFLKLAYDLGWLGLISPAGKCLIGAGFGAVLLGAGEYARRKWSAAASAALSATGVGALYASAYAAYAFYQLVPAPGAFAMLAGASAIGLIVALRARLASVAILSVLSAYLTPVLMTSSDAPAFVLPAYLLVVAGVGLTLSVIHKRFRVLRSLVWWGTAILGTLWVLSEARHAPVIAVTFLTLSWLAFHAELWLSARRGGMGSGARVVDVSRPLLVSLGSTSWAVLLTALTLATQNAPELWLAPGGALVLTSILSMIMAGHLRVLIDRPRNDEERLGACLMAQSGALLIAAVAMGVTTDWLQVGAWLAFGAASVFAGRWIRSRALDAYGLIVLSIGLARLVLLDSWIGAMHTGGVGVFGLVFTEWMLMMACAGAAWIGSGVLLLRTTVDDRPQVLPILGTLVGSMTLLASLLHPDAQYASLTLAWGALAAIAIGAHPIQRRLALDAAGIIALALSYATWTMAYLYEGWTNTAGDWSVHPGLFSALALVALTLAAARWLRGRETLEGARQAMACAAVLLLLVSTSHEVARQVGARIDEVAAQTDALAVWWMLFALAGLAWGVAKRSALAQYIAAGLAPFAGLTWLAAYPSSGWQQSARAWDIHPGLWSAGLIVVMLAVACAWMTHRRAARAAVWTLAISAIVLLFSSTSFEIARHVVRLTDDAATQAGAVSIWWGLFAIALLLWGVLSKRPPARWAGLGLLAIATGKAVILDLAGVDPAWRVASFLGLGLLMIGVGTWYLRALAKAGAGRPEDAADGPDALHAASPRAHT